jgi:hypothetical protein
LAEIALTVAQNRKRVGLETPTGIAMDADLFGVRQSGGVRTDRLQNKTTPPSDLV